MAYSNQLRNVTLKAAANLATRQYHIVELTTNPLECDLAAAGLGFGILQNHPQANEAATVAVEGDSRCRAGGAVSAGQRVTAAASGYAVVVTSGALPTRVLGRAMTAAASGSVFTVNIEQTVTLSGAAN